MAENILYDYIKILKYRITFYNFKRRVKPS